jgi:uncharacterized protein YndB with AHSA1/START domain
LHVLGEQPDTVHARRSRARPSDRAGFETTVTFAEVDGGTVVTLRSPFASAAARDHVVREYGAIEGGRQTLGRLAAYLGAS